MRKLICKFLVLVLLFSFSVEITTLLFRNNSVVSLQMDTQETDEKKDNDKKENEGKALDKWFSNIKLLSLIEIGTDFYLKNDFVKSLDFLSLPEIPPDQA